MPRAALVVLLLASAASAQPRVDLYGDPLPDGAVARLGTTLLQHGVYRDVRFTADGKAFHAAAAGPAWVMWDAATGKRLKHIDLPGTPGHLPWVCADGSTALVDLPGNVRHVVEVGTGKTLVELTTRDKVFRGDPFSPDGRYLATFPASGGGRGGFTAVVRETRTGKAIELGAVTEASGPALFSPDGSRLLVVTAREVTCWAVAEAKQLWRVPHRDTRTLNGPLFSADGKWIAAEAEQPLDASAIVVWDASTGETPPAMKLPPNTRTAPRGFSADGRELLVRVGREPRMMWWNLHDGTERPQPGRFPLRPTPSPDGTRIVGYASQFQMIDAATGNPLLPEVRERRHLWGLSDIAFDPTGTRVFTTGSDGTVRTWNARDGKPVKTVALTQHVPCGEVLFGVAPGGRSCVATFRDNTMETFAVIDLTIGQVVAAVPFSGFDRNRQTTIGRPQLWADGTVFLPRYRSVDAPFLRPGEIRTVQVADSLRWHPAGKTIAAVPSALAPNTVLGRYSADRRLVLAASRVCDAATGQILTRLVSPHGRAFAIGTMSADGRFVAAGVSPVEREVPYPAPSDWRGVCVWDAVSGRFLMHIDTSPELLQLTADGRRLVSADATGLSVWDVTTGKRLRHHAADARRQFHEGENVTAVLTVSPDGELAATGRFDGNALVWDIAVPAVPSDPPSRFELLAAWAILCEPSAARSLAAMWRLVDHPDAAVPFLRDRIRELVKPDPDLDENIRAAIADLADDDFQTREAAEKKLRRWGAAARPQMVEVVRATDSFEQRTRLGRVLAKLDADGVPPLSDAECGPAWALAALERIGTPAARDVVGVVASGPAASRLTLEARAAWERLR